MRQQRERPFGREALPGPAAVRLLGPDPGHQGGLPIVLAVGRRRRRSSAMRAPSANTVRRGANARSPCCVCTTAVAAIEAGQPGAEQAPGRAGRGEQALLQLVVAGDIAQRGQVAIGGADQGAAEAALLRNVDGFDRREPEAPTRRAGARVSGGSHRTARSRGRRPRPRCAQRPPLRRAHRRNRHREPRSGPPNGRCPRSASASAAPTGPPPAISMSTASASIADRGHASLSPCPPGLRCRRRSSAFPR